VPQLWRDHRDRSLEAEMLTEPNNEIKFDALISVNSEALGGM
jgi:hypothetical protein